MSEPAPSPEVTSAEPEPPESSPAAPADTASDPDLEFLGLTSREELEKFHRPLEYIEGIGAVYAGKLSENGINTPLELLREGAAPEGRKAIAKRTEISGLLILEWINHIDLYRIKGVGSEYADLLEESGVDTVMELAHRNPENLFEKMSSVNEVKQLVRKLPAQNQVVDWIEQAKELPRVIHY
jgi:predicted flap endonuclease-1-like 5' DNA nuclease